MLLTNFKDKRDVMFNMNHTLSEELLIVRFNKFNKTENMI